jgi:hypothetical protein
MEGNQRLKCFSLPHLALFPLRLERWAKWTGGLSTRLWTVHIPTSKNHTLTGLGKPPAFAVQASEATGCTPSLAVNLD